MPARTVAVVGAGLGGLSAAARLAHMGLEVDVYEQADHPGGKAGTMELDGFRFDTGPSLVTMPEVLSEPFVHCGRDPSDYLSFHRMEDICHYFWQDGTRLTSHADADRFAAEVEASTGDGAGALHDYLRHCQRIYDAAAEAFLFRSIGDRANFLGRTGLGAVVRLSRMDLRRTMHDANAAAFRDPRMVQLFDRYATYNGSNPYRMPATFNLIQHVEYGLGAYTVEGGVHAIPRAMERLCREEGARIHYRTRVEGIFHEGGAVRGVIVDGEDRGYDLVVSDRDVRATYRDLLGDRTSRPARRYERLEPSTSALVFYWGVEGAFDELGVHNILFSRDYRREFCDLFEGRVCPRDPTVYINITSRYVPGDAPEGCEAWFVMVNAPYEDGQDWAAEVSRTRVAVVDRVEAVLGVELGPLLRCEDVLTPPLIEARTSSDRGALYGISSNTRASAFLRQRNRSRAYRGLYFVGGSAHPGGGMPLAVLSGKIAAELVARHGT